MSLGRFLEIYRVELGYQLRRPLFWIMLIIIVLMAWGISAGNVTVQSGDSSAGGQKAWNTSEYANGRLLSVLGFFIYLFFLTVAAGMVILQDDEYRVGELLHSTPLRAREYVWAKYWAVLSAFALAVAFQVVAMAFFNHAIPAGENAEFRGPLAWSNYWRPAVYFVAPLLLFAAGLFFYIGERLRRPIAVFFLPVVLFLVTVFLLWQWSPSWLPLPINRLLMMIDPAGFRWLNETWLKVDQGVEFYNQRGIQLDPAFIVSRAVFAAVGLLFVWMARSHFERTLRGRVGSAKAAMAAPSAGARPAAVVVAGTRGTLAELEMTTRRTGFLAGTLEVARAESRGLLTQPGVYLFVPLILLEVIASSAIAVGAFDTPLLQTPGTMSVGTLQTLFLLMSLLLMFYTVESLRREEGSGLAPMVYSTPLRSLSLLIGKALANTLVAALVMFAALLGCICVILYQGKVAVDVRPFALVWGGATLPTFFAWSAFIAAVYSITRSRYTSYAVGLSVLMFTMYRALTLKMNWVGNWPLWDSLVWSDMGRLQPNEQALWLNRALVLTAGVFLAILAVRFFPRRELDAGRIVHRLAPGRILRSSWGLLVCAAIPIAIGCVLYVKIEDGFQGEAAKKAQKDYWRRNVKTWTDAPVPDLAAVDVDVQLWPERRHLKVSGSYQLVNRHDHELRRIPVTTGQHWAGLTWDFEGVPFQVDVDESALLCVITPSVPLAPGATLKLGFAFEADFPRGITKNGGGVGEFVLPSGVVLTSFGPQMVPSIGYSDAIGVDDDNESDTREYPDDFHVGQTDSFTGARATFTTRVRITAPSTFTMNGVGLKTAESSADGRTTTVWESDHPVSFFNVVGAPYAVRRGEGTAIYYHPGHEYNIDEMQKALDGARRWYSEWFYPYPWQELKISEFPGIASYAQGFPTNITFSESIGFLTRSTLKSEAAFMVTAHEAAHQWWGNLLAPGKGPGGNILSEGMAHFSTILLTEKVRGEAFRIELCKRFESNYGNQRSVDSERPLVKIDGSRDGDTTVTYDKGGWVFWMLLQHMGRERCLEGIRDFIGRYHQNLDHPVLQDFIAVMREHAEEVEAFEVFTRQWFFEVKVPEFRVRETHKVAASLSSSIDPKTSGSGPNEPIARAGTRSAFEVTAEVENVGTGQHAVWVAAVCGKRFDDAGTPDPGYRVSRTLITVGPGEKQTATLHCDFNPERIEIDPDAVLLQLKRQRATKDF